MSSVQKKIDSFGKKKFNFIAFFSREEIMAKNIKHQKGRMLYSKKPHISVQTASHWMHSGADFPM